MVGFFPLWVFFLILLCSPCLSPALWCSPGYRRAAFFPVKEISGAFLFKLPLTLSWKRCPSPRCRRQALLGKMISLALNIHQPSGPWSVPGMLWQTPTWLLFYVLSILSVAGDFITRSLIACGDPSYYLFVFTLLMETCAGSFLAVPSSKMHRSTLSPSFQTFYFILFFIELQSLELESDSPKVQFQDFSVVCCGGI